MAGKVRAFLAAFDTSTTASGYAVFNQSKNNEMYSLRTSGVINLKQKDVDERTSIMIAGILYRLNESFPEHVVIERPPYVQDPHALIYLSEIVGAVRGWALDNGVDYKEYTPSQWRRLVKEEDEKTPSGRKACKAWDMEKAFLLFGFQPKDDNEADAVLIGAARIKALKTGIDEKIVPPKKRNSEKKANKKKANKKKG